MRGWHGRQVLASSARVTYEAQQKAAYAFLLLFYIQELRDLRPVLTPFSGDVL